MFNIGDIIIYSVHGLCQIEDICEKTISGMTRTYYVLHPLGETSLKISIPINNDKVVMLKPMDKEQAEELIQTFEHPGAAWINDAKQRSHQYVKCVSTGNRDEIAKIANTLMRKNHELKMNNKRLYDQDRSFLQTVQSILYKEMALVLDTTYEAIEERINRLILGA